MGFPSYQEDIQDAKGEPQKYSAQVPIRKTKVVKKRAVKKGKSKAKLRSKSPIQDTVETILMQYAGAPYLTLPETVFFFGKSNCSVRLVALRGRSHGVRVPKRVSHRLLL